MATRLTTNISSAFNLSGNGFRSCVETQSQATFTARIIQAAALIPSPSLSPPCLCSTDTHSGSTFSVSFYLISKVKLAHCYYKTDTDWGGTALTSLKCVVFFCPA